MHRGLCFASLGILLAACGQSPKFPEPSDRGATAPPVVHTDPPKPSTDLPVLTYREESRAASTAKVFLVAGGKESAAYAAEIIEQKKLWLRAGVKAAEIHCYYAIPPKAALQRQASEYRALEQDLAECYPASAGILRRHLAAAA
ncbi:hypothetical protein K2X33_16080, partial [bacterium]|nr:hypothetical protein [bacterium]